MLEQLKVLCPKLGLLTAISHARKFEGHFHFAGLRMNLQQKVVKLYLK